MQLLLRNSFSATRNLHSNFSPNYLSNTHSLVQCTLKTILLINQSPCISNCPYTPTQFPLRQSPCSAFNYMYETTAQPLALYIILHSTVPCQALGLYIQPSLHNSISATRPVHSTDAPQFPINNSPSTSNSRSKILSRLLALYIQMTLLKSLSTTRLLHPTFAPQLPSKRSFFLSNSH